MLSGDTNSHLRPGRLQSYHQAVQLRRPRFRKKSRKSDARSPYQLEKELQNIVVTREVYTTSEHSPDTPPPPRELLRAVRLRRSVRRPRILTMNMPPPLPQPSSWISTVPQSPKTTTSDGLHFCEDPRFRTWHKSLLTRKGLNTAPIGAFESDTEVQDSELPCKALSKESLGASKSNLSAEPPGDRLPHAHLEGICLSPDSCLYENKRLSCTHLQLPSTGIGRSATLLKARIAQKVRLSRSIRERLHSSKPEELTRIQEPGRIGIPRQITIGRKLQWQTQAENSQFSSGIEDVAMQSHTTLRLVTSRFKDPRTTSIARDPELLAMLHDPNQKRFSDSWEKFYAEQTQETVGEGGRLPVVTNITGSTARVKDQSFAPIISQELTSSLADSRMGSNPPVIKITESRDEALKLVPPSAELRTSSRGAILTKLLGPGKVPPPVANPSPSTLLNRPRPSNISKPRKAPESSLMADYEKGVDPARSTDTLAKIEVELQVSPNRPALANISNVPVRLPKNISTDNGPSGNPPERALPQLPDDDTSENSRSRRSSGRRHSPKLSQSSLGHGRNKPSISSISAVEGMSHSKTGKPGNSTQDHAWKAHHNPRESAIYRPAIDPNPVSYLAMTKSDTLQSPAQIYSQEYGFPTPAENFSRKQAQRAARVESRRAIKQRDLAASYRAIKEENESETVSSPRQVVDTIDQFPEPPLSRSASRASRTSPRRARSTQRTQSTARRVPPRGVANQILTANRVVSVEDAGPTTPNLKSKRSSTGSPGQCSPVRESPVASRLHEVAYNLPKTSTVRSHTSTSAVGTHVPPSSDPGASDEDLTGGDLHRPTLRREIQEIRACMIMQGRAIDNLQNMMVRCMTIRSRSREMPLERQLSQGPPTLRIHPRRAISSTSDASDAAPGPAIMNADSMIDSAHEGVGYESGEGMNGSNRLSGAPEAAKMDNMVDQTFRRLW